MGKGIKCPFCGCWTLRAGPEGKHWTCSRCPFICRNDQLNWNAADFEWERLAKQQRQEMEWAWADNVRLKAAMKAVAGLRNKIIQTAKEDNSVGDGNAVVSYYLKELIEQWGEVMAAMLAGDLEGLEKILKEQQ